MQESDFIISTPEGGTIQVEAKAERGRRLNRERVKRWREREKQKRGIEVDLESGLTSLQAPTIIHYAVIECPQCGKHLQFIIRDPHP
jgi:hypothetical protein